MEEKKEVKVKLSTVLLILALIVIAILAYFVYKFYNEKRVESEKVEESSSQIADLENTVNQLQGKINDISNTINSNNETEITNIGNVSKTGTTSKKGEAFTENQVKKALSNYLELDSYANVSALLEILTEKGDLNYKPSEDTLMNNGATILTTIMYSRYKDVMLNYVSEAEFERNWTKKNNFGEDENGFLTKGEGGGGLRSYTVKSISKINDSTYTAQTSYIIDDDKNYGGNEKFEFRITSYNNKCVIDSIKVIK